MSPASASSTAVRSMPRKASTLVTAGFDQLAIMIEHLDALVRLDRSRSNASGNDAAEIGISFQNGAEQAERTFLHHRRLDVAEDQIEQRLHAVVVRTLKCRRHPALLG